MVVKKRCLPLKDDLRQLESRRQSALLQCRESAKSGCEQTEQVAPLLDHLVGAAEQQRGHVEADCLCGTDVDHQLEPGRLYNRQVGGLGAHQNSACVVADLEVCIAKVCTVGQESAGCGELTTIVNRRNRVACCKRDNSITPAVQERVGGYKQRTGPLF